MATCGDPAPGVLHVQVANLHLLGRLPTCATIAGWKPALLRRVGGRWEIGEAVELEELEELRGRAVARLAPLLVHEFQKAAPDELP